MEVDGELVAPNLTKLSQEGYYNSRFYSAGGMGNTSDCEFASNIGMYPNGNDLSVFELDGENYPTIASEFKKLGYKTLSMHGNDGAFYNRNNQHVSLFSFDEHIDKLDLLERNPNLELVKDWISDKAMLEESINIYNELNSKNALSSISEFDQYVVGNTLVCKVENYDNGVLKQLADALLNKLGKGVVFLANVVDGKIVFVCKQNDKFNAGSLVKLAAVITGGNGGGKPDIAQAGGKDVTKLDEALLAVKKELN